MCVMSMIHDHYNPYEPRRPNQWTPFVIPATHPNVSPDLPWTKELLAELKKILAAVEALDKKLGLPDCHDPAKAAFIPKIEAKLKKAKKGRTAKK